MDKSRFESIGVYLPEKVVTTQELIDRMENKPEFDLEKLTGIKERRWRAANEDSRTLALTAARRCLANSRYEAKDLDVIISCSITRFQNTYFQLEPALSKTLKIDIGMRPGSINFDITNACAGMMTGVYILDSMIKCGAIKTGMVVSGECITPITETAVKEIDELVDPQFASLTVGDSGAACILDQAVNGDGVISIVDMFSLSEHADLCLGMPSDRNPGIAMYTDAMGIHKEVVDRLPILMPYYSDTHNIAKDDYDFIIPHQTSTRAIKTALDACIPLFQKREKTDYFPEVPICLDKYGNTSSTSHLVVLWDYLRSGKMKPGARVMFLVLASGIVMGIIDTTIGNLQVN